jgi:hypothetical protein
LKKLILLSVIIASVVIAARAARAKSGKAGLKKTLIQTAIFDLIYVVLLTQVWFRMGPYRRMAERKLPAEAKMAFIAMLVLAGIASVPILLIVVGLATCVVVQFWNVVVRGGGA